MASEEAELYKLWRIRKTVLQLCHDRGYLITQDELEETYDQFKYNCNRTIPQRSELTLICTHHHNPDDKMFVFFPDEPKIGVKTIQAYVARMEAEKVARGVVIVDRKSVV